MDFFRKMTLEESKKKTEEAVEIIKEIHNKYVDAEEKILALEKEIEEDKDEKFRKLEKENQNLKKQIADFELTTELYGFTPKEREFVDKWWKPHLEKKENSLKSKVPSHHLSYIINIYPEATIKTVKCKCGCYMDIYDTENDAWAYDSKGNKKRFTPDK